MKRALGKMVVGNLIVTAAIRYPELESFYCSSTNRRFTFRQTNERCNRLANGLSDLGLSKGDKVAFLSTNRVEVVEIYFALAKLGLIGIPLNYRLAPVEMISLMRDIGANAMLVERRYGEVAQLALTELPHLAFHVSFGEGPAGSGRDYEALLAVSAVSEPIIEVEESDPFVFNLTSGTTGLPKCYPLTHYNNATLASWFLCHDMSSGDVVLTVFPMFGRVGFCWAACSVMYGIRNVIANFEPDATLRLIGDERVTVTNLVPTMAAMLLATPALESSDLSSLRALILAGSLLPASIREASIARLCPRLYEYYGMQESGTLVVSTPQDRLRQPESVGRAIPFAEIRVIDAQGRDVTAGETGAIIARSPGSVTAYYENPEKSAETFRDGWLHTGDLGRLDAEGFLFISGRLKEVIVTGGQNVHAGEIEEFILTHPDVTDCAVIGLPDPLWGEAVTAIVVPRDGASIDGDDIVRLCRKQLAGFKTPKRVLLQKEPLPRTPTGKIQKFSLVERYRSTDS